MDLPILREWCWRGSARLCWEGADPFLFAKLFVHFFLKPLHFGLSLRFQLRLQRFHPFTLGKNRKLFQDFSAFPKILSTAFLRHSFTSLWRVTFV